MLPLLLAATLALASTAAGPPPTEADPVTETIHGETIVDPFRWLESLEKDSEKVKAWTTAQLDYTRSVLDGLPCRKQVEAQLAKLMTVGSVGAPITRGNRYFYTKREGTQNQPVLYLREGFDGDANVLLDVNALDDKGLYALDWWTPSEDGSLVAFGLSYAGSEMTTLHVMRVDGGRWLSDEIPGKCTFGGWLPDASGFLYSQLEDPANAYSRRVRFHRLGEHHRQDPVILTQQAPSRVPFGSLSRDGRWMFLGISDGWSRNDLYVVDVPAWRRTGEIVKVAIAEGLDGRFEPGAVVGNTAYVLTTFEAPNAKAIAVDLAAPAASVAGAAGKAEPKLGRDTWRDFIKERKDAVLQSVEHARGFIVATYEKDACSRIEKFRLDGAPAGDIKLPGLGTASIATDDDRTEAFVSYTSFNEPASIYRVDVATGERNLWARPDVPVDPSSVEVEQAWCTSRDGTKVPMFIVHKKGLQRNGDNPTLVYGYGGFNQSMTPNFRAERFVWFDAGGVYVQVNLRGGGEYGEQWHQAGMLDRKQNVFDDLYAATEQLVKDGWTKPERLAVLGGSNGGLLTGAAATQRPDLYAAVVCAVPLLDMLRYQQFLMAKFWVPEYGSAENAEQFKWLRAYSPYHNVKKGQRYPAILFTAGENDSRVHPLHARKMTALMQASAANDFAQHPILLWVDREGGHGQGKPLALRVRDAADQYCFLMWQTGCCKP
ncbi:MAG: prolyl oligopeptidase family serine peptidase [Phycisphaerales bacterium]